MKRDAEGLDDVQSAPACENVLSFTSIGPVFHFALTQYNHR
jgi:hypothetical protein